MPFVINFSPPRTDKLPDKKKSLLRAGLAVTLAVLTPGAKGAVAILRWENAAGRPPKALQPQHMQVTILDLPKKFDGAARHLDVAAAKAMLQQELPLSATPASPIYIYYLDNENAARYRAEEGGLHRSLKNKHDIQAALEGLEVTQVVPVPSTALARTMKPKHSGLETAQQLFPPAAAALRSKTPHEHLAQALLLAGHVIGAPVKDGGPALAQADNSAPPAAVVASDSVAVAAPAGAPAVVPAPPAVPAVPAVAVLAVPATPARAGPGRDQAGALQAAEEAAGGAAVPLEQPAVVAAAAAPEERAAARTGPSAQPAPMVDAGRAPAPAAAPAWATLGNLLPQLEQSAALGRPVGPASPAGAVSLASPLGPVSPTPSRPMHVSGRRPVAARGSQELPHAAAAPGATAGAGPASGAEMRKSGRREHFKDLAAPEEIVDLTGEDHSASAGPVAKRRRAPPVIEID